LAQRLLYWEIPQRKELRLKVKSNCTLLSACTLINGEQDTGYHKVKWNGKDEFDQNVVSSIYFYRLELNEFRETKKMTLIR